MAREIKPTPVIKGKDAVIFYENLENNRNRKADISILQRIENSVDFFKKNVAFV